MSVAAMDQEIVRNHVAVSDTARVFLDYAVAQGNCLSRAALLDAELPPLFRNYEYALHSWPWFLGAAMRKTLEQCVCAVPTLVRRAIDVEFGGDAQRLAAYFRMPEMLAQLYLDTPADLTQMVQRTDAVLTEQGLKIMEINVGSNIGGWQIQWMDRQYRKHPSLQPFFGQVACESKNIPLGFMTRIIENAMRFRHDPHAEIHVFMLVSDDFLAIEDSRATIGSVFQAALKNCGCTGALHFANGYDALQFTPRGVHFDGKHITAVISVPGPHAGEAPPQMLYRAYLTNQVAWPDNPFVATIGDKRSLALAYKHKDHPTFSAEERRLIEYFIPWSCGTAQREVEYAGQRVELEGLLLDRREQFVVKAARGARGNDVHVGKYRSAEEWAPVVRRALREPHDWLVQEFCGSLPFYGQLGESGYGLHDVIWGVFGFGMHYGGCWLRLTRRGSGDGIINSARGAQETIVYEVTT